MMWIGGDDLAHVVDVGGQPEFESESQPLAHLTRLPPRNRYRMTATQVHRLAVVPAGVDALDEAEIDEMPAGPGARTGRRPS
jgi:hypothetical protein